MFDPVHCNPPFDGGGFVHSRVRKRFPKPQVVEHAEKDVQSLHKPFTGPGVITNVCYYKLKSLDIIKNGHNLIANRYLQGIMQNAISRACQELIYRTRL